MKLTGILILNSVLITLGLLSSGAYIIVDNLVEPSGNLFEGIVIFSLGTVMSMLLLVASTLGKVIQTFADVYTQQIEIQQKVNDFYNKSKPKPITIGDILNNAKSDSITITNLETGETTSQSLDDERINKIFSGSDPIGNFLSNMMANRYSPEENLNNLTVEQLEKELSNAVKADNFELAQTIKEQIKKLKGGN